MSSYIRELLFNHPVVNELGTEFQMEYAGRDDEAALEKFLLERKNNENVSLSRDFWAMPYYLEERKD